MTGLVLRQPHRTGALRNIQTRPLEPAPYKTRKGPKWPSANV